jgi:hypothetical protein
MAIFTLAEVEEQLAAWKQALLAASTSQSYPLPSGRRVTPYDLSEIRKAK